MVRKVLLTMLLGVLVAAAAGLGVKLHADRHFFDGYDSAAPLNAEVVAKKTVEGTVEAFDIETPARYRLEEVRFEARPGEPVPTLVTLPLDGEGPFPVVVFLHGSHQEKEFLEEICPPFCEAGFAMACFDQYMRGGRRVRAEGYKVGFTFRERTWKTVHDARRLIDYLVTRPDIDAGRVYFCGASYGAITGTTVVAMEPRIQAAVLVVGGGNLPLVVQSPFVKRELPKWMLPIAKPAIRFFMGAADPVRFAPMTAGTPVLMQNGDKDTIVPPPMGEALYAALGEPKELRWYPIDHPDREEKGEEVIRMLGEGLDWLRAQDLRVRAEAGAGADDVQAGAPAERGAA